VHLSKESDFIPKKYKRKRVPRHYFITSKGEVIYTFVGYGKIENFNAFLYDLEKNYLKKYKGK
jgi:hypothetical protein